MRDKSKYNDFITEESLFSPRWLSTSYLAKVLSEVGTEKEKKLGNAYLNLLENYLEKTKSPDFKYRESVANDFKKVLHPISGRIKNTFYTFGVLKLYRDKKSRNK
ncbi:MAG: hypothetical protein WA139_02815 [Candidatus Aenigmatarchaeota archaeon]